MASSKEGEFQNRNEKALKYAERFGSVQGDHHRAWVIDQMVRALLGCPMKERKLIGVNGKVYISTSQGESAEYQAWVLAITTGEDGTDTYVWDTGVQP